MDQQTSSGSTTKKEIVPYFSVLEKEKFIQIPFENWFGEGAQEFGRFTISLSTKKTYARLAKTICSESNEILARDQGLAERIIYSYYVLKRSIDTGYYTQFSSNKELGASISVARSSEAVFISDVITQIVTPELLEHVKAYVDERYVHEIDKSIDLSTHKYDLGTTFMDRHFKVMYMISNLCRIIAPMCTHFASVTEDVDSKKFFYNAFINIFRIVQTREDMDIYSKLHTYIQREIQKTIKVDDQMWSQLTIFGLTPQSAVEDAMRRMVTDIFPKFIFELSAIHLISVVIRMFTGWTFRKEHPFSIHALSDVEGQGSDDDTVVSESDIFDSYAVKRDESIIVLRSTFAWDTIEKIMVRNNIKIDPEELEWYQNTRRKIHEFHRFCVTSAFSRPFGGAKNLSGCTRKQWMTLMVIASKMMEAMGIRHLPDFLLGEKIRFNYKRVSKALDAQIVNHPLYKSLIEEKYFFVQNTLATNNFIRTPIIMLINNDYSHLKYGDLRNKEQIEKNEEKILEEVLAFFNLIII